MNNTLKSRRGASIAFITAVLLVVPLVALGQGRAQAVPDDPGYIGCTVVGDVVSFTFDLSQYGFVSRGDNGAVVPISDVPLDESTVVAVAGEFNGWSVHEWTLELLAPGVYATSRPLEQFAGQDSWAFKFVVDGMFWVEPPATAPNAVPTGLGNDSMNLMLVLTETEAARLASMERVPRPDRWASPPEIVHVESPLLDRLTLSDSQMPESCVFKTVDPSMGTAPIPMDSNPLITSDHRTIGFISVFVMPPSPEEEAAWEAETSSMAPDAVMTRIDAIMMERTANVRAAYIAVYESVEGKREMGVFALEFSEPLEPERSEALRIEGPGGAVFADEWVAAAVWTDDPDRTCYDAVRAHVAEVLGE